MPAALVVCIHAVNVILIIQTGYHIIELSQN